jgi:hypothetical protein
VLLTTRRNAVNARMQAVNQLKALIVSAPEELRTELRGRGTKAQISYCAALRERPTRSLEHQMTAWALQVTARRLQLLRAEADTLQHDIHALVAPWLLELPGVGPITAAQVLVSWSHAGRWRSEAAFAAPGQDQPDPGLLGAGDPLPAQPPDADRPFSDDTEHASYDPAWVSRYWVVLSQVNLLLEEFAARFSGKVSPVHHFWHTFDIAHTRFSDRHVDQPATADPVTREAYSREVISFGFWFGDDRFPEPAFYAYTAPEAPGLADERLRPVAAWWDPRDGSHLAVLRYDDARAQPDPRATVLDFYESAYQAGARLAGWDIQRLPFPGGITDPRLCPDKG